MLGHFCCFLIDLLLLSTFLFCWSLSQCSLWKACWEKGQSALSWQLRTLQLQPSYMASECAPSLIWKLHIRKEGLVSYCRGNNSSQGSKVPLDVTKVLMNTSFCAANASGYSCYALYCTHPISWMSYSSLLHYSLFSHFRFMMEKISLVSLGYYLVCVQLNCIFLSSFHPRFSFWLCLIGTEWTYFTLCLYFLNNFVESELYLSDLSNLKSSPWEQ